MDLVCRWDNKSVPVLDVSTYTIRNGRGSPENDSPDPPWEPPALVRGFGLALTAAYNVVSIAVAVAAFSLASTKFETAALSLLVLLYASILALATGFTNTLAMLDMMALRRFYVLREALGLAKTPDEEKYITGTQRALARADAKRWIHTIGQSLIGLLAVYKLTALFW